MYAPGSKNSWILYLKDLLAVPSRCQGRFWQHQTPVTPAWRWDALHPTHAVLQGSADLSPKEEKALRKAVIPSM
jgi:hypothetical protein